MTPPRVPLAFLGGTGKHGRALALRLAAAGHPVVLGSRVAARAREAAETVAARLAGAGTPARTSGVVNADAAGAAPIVFLTLPFDGLDALLATHGGALAGKIVVDVVVPLRAVGERFTLHALGEGSASMRIQRVVPGARVVAAFKNVAASRLLAWPCAVEGDVLIATDDAEAGEVVAGLARTIPDLRPVAAGPLANAGLLEALTALELNLNRVHDATTAVRILGL